MDNIQKAFKAKSKLRGMADGGRVDPRMLGSGAAAQAGLALQRRGNSIDDALEGATGDAGMRATPRPAARPAAAPATPAPAKKPEERSALRSFFGLADGGNPAAILDRVGGTDIFTPQEMGQFNAMGQSAQADAAQMQDFGVQAGQSAMASSMPAEVPADDLAPPEVELADGGKVKGKGGPTDDKIGPVALSDGEYVLPADTVDIVGRDKLDALRLATHDFVDDKNKPTSGLRKMANGGTFYVDPEGVARRSLADNLPARTGQPAGAAQLPARAPIEGTATRLPPATVAPAPAASSLRGALNSGGGKVGNFARGALPLAAIGGAATSMADTTNGVRDQRLGTMGVDVNTAGAGKQALGDTARTLSDVGDSITFGLAGRVGRGLANIGGDGGFSAGFMSPSDRDKILTNQTQRVMSAPATGAAQPAQQGVDQSARAVDTSLGRLRLGEQPGNGFAREDRFSGQGYSVYGRDNPNAGQPGQSARQYTGVGTAAPAEDPIMGELRSALRGMTQNTGNSGGGGGGSYSSSGERDINARYDKLASQLSGMYGPKGQGNLARRMLELEQSRSGALDASARNQSALRGQDMQAGTAANNASMQARMQALQTLGTLAGQRTSQNAASQAAQLKALQDAQKMGQQTEETGFTRYTGAIGNMFVDPATGKPDAAEQEKFTSFLQASDPRAREKFAAMAPQDQMSLLQNFKTLYDMNKARNETATGGLMNSGAVTNRADMPADVREATWNDVWNNHLPVTDYVQSNLPFTNPNVVVGESGQPVPLSRAAVDADGNWDADKLELIRQRTGKDKNGRSALRGN